MDDDLASGHFRAIDLFSGFDDEQLRLLNFVSETLVLSRGDVLYDAGEPANGAYVLISGQLEAVHTPIEGGARHGISAPALVGELGLMLTRPRATRIAAKTGAEVIFVPREPFLKILRTDPDLAAEVADILRGELARYLDSISALGPRFS